MDQLYLLDVHKSVRLGRINLRVLKELADAISGPLLIIYKGLGSLGRFALTGSQY